MLDYVELVRRPYELRADLNSVEMGLRRLLEVREVLEHHGRVDLHRLRELALLGPLALTEVETTLLVQLHLRVLEARMVVGLHEVELVLRLHRLDLQHPLAEASVAVDREAEHHEDDDEHDYDDHRRLAHAVT